VSSDLPWISRDAPAKVGVCLSGGGLRAASFAYGAVQGLQATRGLLYGERCADYLAVVSGGSYLAAALMLNSIPPQAPGAKSPLERTTAEAVHVSTHGTYFKHFRIIARIVLFLVVNLLAFASLFYFVALGLVVAAELQQELGVDPPLQDTAGLYAVALGALLVGGFWWLRGLYRVAARHVWVIGFLVLVAGAPSIVGASQRLAGGWTWWALGAVAAGLFVLAGAIFGLGKRWGDSPLWRPVGWLGARMPAIAGLGLLCLAMSELADAFVLDDGFELGDGALAASLLLWLAVSWLAGRVSLHRLYRERLATCFSVRRANGGVALVGDTNRSISAMRPPARGQAASCPRVLVCATANVIWDRKRHGHIPTIMHPLRGRRYASFVYSHDRCGIPEAPGASFDTAQLERLTTHAGVRRDREPLISLMTAVASTGAAASPAMGRKTSSFLRTAFALTNVRLGRWLPNPMSETIRREVACQDADTLMRRRRVLGSGFNEFVPELFGLHRADAPRIYVSDGGHYDNLGLIALLHARCKQIWCVDAQADPRGGASQLRSTLRLAESEVCVTADVAPLDDLQSGSSHAVLELRYPEGQTATLIVIKLSLSTPELEATARKLADKRFPHHNTFWPPRVMWYGPERFRAYGEVGYQNAQAAASDARVPVPT
jgi:hypothetical protein